MTTLCTLNSFYNKQVFYDLKAGRLHKRNLANRQVATASTISALSCLRSLLFLSVAGVMHEADNAYSIRSTWLCYRQARFLTTANNVNYYTDFVASF